MPTTQTLLNRHQATLEALEGALEAFPEEDWLRAGRSGGWCAAEVFDHIGRIAEGYAFVHLEACLGGKGRPGAKAWVGRLVLLLGRIPGAWRLRAPFPPELMPRAVSRAEAREMLGRLRLKGEAFAPRVEAADPSLRVRHFRLGWLNAREWYQFAEMHHRHHLEGQLRRLLRKR